MDKIGLSVAADTVCVGSMPGAGLSDLKMSLDLSRKGAPWLRRSASSSSDAL
jgi:hypothetical protein